jgi:hypothetical protein
MEIKFRDLKEEEVECRIASIGKTGNGLSLLLYKDARVDQNILDETVKPENWQRDHKELKGNIYCGMSIWDENKKMWITKWDAGKESNTEAEKGEASDSFKRAGFNWGIGRELYTSPFIWIPSTKCKITDNKCYDKFKVTHLKIENKEITELNIKNATSGVECFNWKKEKEEETIKDDLVSDKEAKIIYASLIKKLGDADKVADYLIKKYEIDNTSKLMKSQYAEIVREFK